MHTPKPKTRSSIRIYFGMKYYRLKRYIEWFKRKNYYYALTKDETLLKNNVFEH